ncbi:TolC family protein [Hippea jasoniae]|uniref:TolC family protein n=1 Tax=Hippea jasoniae TaxID=944479 RepID=UPI000557EBB2|nr:TolC family protein [Hippea jasoniae]
MKKLIFFLIIAFFCIFSDSKAATIQQLFRGLQNQPVTKIDKAEVAIFKAKKYQTISNFFPKIFAVASYQHFNSPTNLRPMTPKESSDISRSFGSMPFGKNIKQIGIEFSAPLFVASLFDMAHMSEKLKESAQWRMKINFIKNEAVVVELNGEFIYLERLKQSIEKRKASLDSQLKSIKLACENGRLPCVYKYKVEDAINALDIKLNDVDAKITSIANTIYALTGIRLSKPAKMALSGNITGRKYKILESLRLKTEALKYSAKASKDKLYPSLMIKGFVYRKFTKAYNTNENTLRNYGSIGVFLSIPIFDKPLYSEIEKSHSEYVKSEFELEDYTNRIKAKAKTLKKTLDLIDKSIIIQNKSVSNSKKLLKYAKVAFKLGRMTLEEYLRYEADLLNSEAELYSLKLKKWQVVSELAVIYGEDLKEIVR